MKKKYLSIQFKQFAISSVFVAVAAIGLSVSNSFDQEYMAQVKKTEQNKTMERYAESSKKDKKKEKKTGVALN